MNTANVSISTWELEQVIFTNCTRSISHYSTYSFIILTLLKVRGGLFSEKPIPRKNPNSEDKKKIPNPGNFLYSSVSDVHFSMRKFTIGLKSRLYWIPELSSNLRTPLYPEV